MIIQGLGKRHISRWILDMWLPTLSTQSWLASSRLFRDALLAFLNVSLCIIIYASERSSWSLDAPIIIVLAITAALLRRCYAWFTERLPVWEGIFCSWRRTMPCVGGEFGILGSGIRERDSFGILVMMGGWVAIECYSMYVSSKWHPERNVSRMCERAIVRRGDSDSSRFWKIEQMGYQHYKVQKAKAKTQDKEKIHV